MSCASADNCSVGGYYTDNSGNLQAFVVSQTSGAWGKAAEIPGTAALRQPELSRYSSPYPAPGK